MKAQLSVDGRSFNDFGFLDDSVGKTLDEITDLFSSYHRVIDREEFEPLLQEWAPSVLNPQEDVIMVQGKIRQALQAIKTAKNGPTSSNDPIVN